MPSWLKRVFDQWFPVPKTPSPPKEFSQRERCMFALESLGLPNQIRYVVFKAQAKQICPNYRNIEEYTDMLHDLEVVVRTDKPIKMSWLSGGINNVTMDEWMVSKTGHYVDIQTAVVLFQYRASKLCEALVKCEGQVHGVREHNLRILTNLMEDIVHICEAIKEVGTN